MDIVKEIKRIIGEKRNFTLDMHHNEDEVTIIIIVKDLIAGISFEPFITKGKLEGMDNVFVASFEEHYTKIKDDINSVEKFLGVKTFKQSVEIKEKVAEVSILVKGPPIIIEEEDDDFDLKF